MTYEEFTARLGEYSALFEKGLKKQANKLLFAFAEGFKSNVPQDNADELLFRFCREFYDEGGFPELREHGCIRLPYQLMGLLHEYLNRECAAEKMPQMRWAYQLFGRYYNPHDPNLENDPYDILERAYSHPDCDQKTVELYFESQIDELDFGAHHFPEGCCIAREVYEEDVRTAEKILAEHELPPEYAEELEYYKTLYRVYFEWSDGGGKGDFDELCEAAGISFTAPKAFYYTK
ncbi:MAG: hypothetical protein K2J80_00255 [Oscillospiraceae bacterium]|nr:hypothetical protein [Oscillospiraceae bacterium]